MLDEKCISSVLKLHTSVSIQGFFQWTPTRDLPLIQGEGLTTPQGGANFIREVVGLKKNQGRRRLILCDTPSQKN